MRVLQVCICLAKISLLDGARTRKSTNAINIFVPISPAFKNAFVPMTKTTCKAVHAMPEREKRQIEVCSRFLALSLTLWRSRAAGGGGGGARRGTAGALHAGGAAARRRRGGGGGGGGRRAQLVAADGRPHEMTGGSFAALWRVCGPFPIASIISQNAGIVRRSFRVV
jgi:hypothetical protein